MEITYQSLETLLNEIGFMIQQKNEIFIIVGKTKNESVYKKKGAVYGEVISKEEDIEKAAKDLFRQLKNSGEILIGTITTFEEKILFETQKFVRYELSEEEKIEFNLDY